MPSKYLGGGGGLACIDNDDADDAAMEEKLPPLPSPLLPPLLALAAVPSMASATMTAVQSSRHGLRWSSPRSHFEASQSQMTMTVLESTITMAAQEAQGVAQTHADLAGQPRNFLAALHVSTVCSTRC